MENNSQTQPQAEEPVTMVSPQTMGGFTEPNTLSAILPKKTIKSRKYLIILGIALFFILFIAGGIFIFYRFFLPKTSASADTPGVLQTSKNLMYRIDENDYAFEFSYAPELAFETGTFYFSPFLKNVKGGFFRVYSLSISEDYKSIFDLTAPLEVTDVTFPLINIIEGQRSYIENLEDLIIYTKIYVFSDNQRNIIFEFNIDEDNKFKDNYLSAFDESAKSFVFTKGPALEAVQESTPSLPTE